MLKTLLKNLSLFSNWQTLFVTFVIEPFFVVLFFYLIGSQVGFSKIILTALVLSASSTIIGIYAQLFVYAMSIEILKLIFINLKGFLKFEGAILLIANMVALLQSSILLIIYRLLGFKFEISPMNALILLVSLVIFSSIFASIVSFLSLRGRNPFFYSNLLLGFLPIISATVVSIDSYPAWLALVSKIFPFWGLQNIVWKGEFPWLWMVFYLSSALGLLVVIFTFTRKRILAT